MLSPLEGLVEALPAPPSDQPQNETGNSEDALKKRLRWEAWIAKNKAWKKEYMRLYRPGYLKKNRKAVNAQKLRWYHTTKDKRRETLRAYARAKYKENPDRFRAKHRVWAKKHRTYMLDYRRRLTLAKNFGITVERYDELHKEQGGVCAICKKPNNVKSVRLAVDHCHTTKLVRGLLCGNCNNGLGHFKDSIENMKRAIEYLNLNEQRRMFAPKFVVEPESSESEPAEEIGNDLLRVNLK